MIEILSGEEIVSDKFWKLEKRINQPKGGRKLGSYLLPRFQPCFFVVGIHTSYCAFCGSGLR